MADSQHKTTDHDKIRQWAEDRDAQPAVVKDTMQADDIGILRLNFPGYSGDDDLTEISWEAFFEKFEEAGLALIYQEQTEDGQQSSFNKLVSR